VKILDWFPPLKQTSSKKNARNSPAGTKLIKRFNHKNGSMPYLDEVPLTDFDRYRYPIK
jgi:hypothetical protein